MIGNSITTRLIVLLTLSAVVIIGSGMLLDYRLSSEQVLERVQLESQDAVRAAVTDMEHWLDGVEGSTRLLARILQQRDYSHEGLQQMLKDVVENNQDIYGATIALNPAQAGSSRGFAPYYFHRQGILTYANLADEQYQYPEQAWYRDTVAAGKPVWVTPYFDAGGGDILMTTYAVPVFRVDGDGQRFLYAVVTADIALAELEAFLRQLRQGDNGFGFLLSRTGIFLGAPDPDYLMHHYADLVSSTEGLERWSAMFKAALHGQIVSQQIPCPQFSGACVLRMSKLESTGWPVGIVYSEKEILAPLRNYQFKTALISLLSLLIMAIAVVVVTRRITRPLEDLARTSGDIARGKLDTPLPRARGSDEVAHLIESFGSMKKDLKTYIADLETAAASRARLEGELGAARAIQMSMLPQGGEAIETTEHYCLWARVRPAKSVGGDLYSFYRAGNSLFFAVGDVSDKGVPAALFMARAISLIQQLAGTGITPALAMAAVNNALESGNDNCMFVTLFLGVLDLENLELHFASAGHTPPSLHRGDSVHSVEQDSGPALGLAPNLDYPDNCLQLQAGDRLAVFTDGIDEAFNADNAMFGIEGFNRALQAHRPCTTASTGAGLLQAVDNFAGDTPQSDDITLLLLDIPAAGARSVNALDKDLQRSVRSFTCGERLAGEVLDWLQALLQKTAGTAEAKGELLVAAEEIVTNIHKYAQLPAAASITVTAESSSELIVLEVSDPGMAFNPLQDSTRSTLGSATAEAEIGGLGIHLITTLTDQQSYRHEDGCNILRVTKLLGS